jgi:hypothetical protein
MLFFYTDECEWKSNEGYVSCVPIGVYDFLPHESPRHADCYLLEKKAMHYPLLTIVYKSARKSNRRAP